MNGEGMNLIGWVVDDANSVGEDFNDGDVHPGWLTAEWLSDTELFVTYENPASDVFTAKYRVERIDG
jgi:hypothetical protein